MREKLLEEKVNELWIKPSVSPSTPKSLSGVDGGSAKVDFQGFTLYAVDAVAPTYYDMMNDRYESFKVFSLADVDIPIPPQVSVRIDMYREILEAKVALAALSERRVELLLMDGSLRSVLITPLSIESLVRAERMVSKVFGDEVYSELERILSKQVVNYNVLRMNPIASKDIIESYGEELTEEELPAVVLIEYIEKLETYRRLISKALDSGTLLAFISKTARSQLYFGVLCKKLGRYIPPDIIVFQALTSSDGFSKPHIDVKPVKVMPSILSLRSFYDRLRIITTYVRLEDGGPVLKVEIPYLGNVSEDMAINDVLRLFKYMKSLSSNGYPYVLAEAHELSRISRDALGSIAYMLDLTSQRTGREVLGEWRV